MWPTPIRRDQLCYDAQINAVASTKALIIVSTSSLLDSRDLHNRRRGLVTLGQQRHLIVGVRDSGRDDHLMPHHTFAAVDRTYRGFIRAHEWSVCVGAGISSGIMPSWIDLTRTVFAKATGQTLTSDSFSKLCNQTGWGMDAWLQASLNSMIRDGRTRKEFIEIVEDELYKKLLLKAGAASQKDILLKALVAPKKCIKVVEAQSLLKFMEDNFGDQTLFGLARWLRKSKQCENPPRAVLTFNADCLLDVVLSLLATDEHVRNTGEKNFPKEEFKRVLRASDDGREATPIFHLHGCVLPKSGKSNLHRESREELVFPESGYSRISSTVFTWQQTVFLSHAQSQRLVFIGLSMSDPNLRRWLSWCTANAVTAQQHRLNNFNGEYIMGENIWLTTRPSDPAHETFLESSLLHLGTRIGWLDSWNQLPEALNNLLGLD